MQTNSQLGVAVIGAGRAGMIHARNFGNGHVQGARLVAIADPVAAALEGARSEFGGVAVYTDYVELLNDAAVDAVVVATPSAEHCAIVRAAAGAGKHILCEKPMAMNAGECDLMLKAVAEAGVKLQIGFMRRFDANFMAAKERIEADEIGQVVQVKSLTHGPTTPKPWMYDIRISNGPLSEVNSHDIDTVRWFSGSDFEEVHAIAGNYRSPNASQEYPHFYDNVVLSARLANGMQGVVLGAQGVQYGYDARCEVLGERGLITVGDLAATSVFTHTVSGSNTQIVHSWMRLFLDAYRNEDAAFTVCIHEDQPPQVSGLDGKAAVMVVNAGNRSIVERRPVLLSEVAMDACGGGE